MSSQNVTIYLNTPLVQPELGMAGMEHISRIKGSVQSSDVQMVTVTVKAIGDESEWQDSKLPFKKITIPLHKIDFIQVE